MFSKIAISCQDGCWWLALLFRTTFLNCGRWCIFACHLFLVH